MSVVERIEKYINNYISMSMSTLENVHDDVSNLVNVSCRTQTLTAYFYF